jgi:glycerophosphoryl diester phosphodiesterase
MWNELTTPTVIAHRGDSVSAPENTLSAFQQAIDKGAKGIEFDVKLTADDQVIVLHDQTLDRTTDGQGDVSKFPLAALRELNASVNFPGMVPHEKIPTLVEVFESFSNRVFMNLELKNYSTPFDDLVPNVVGLVKEFNLEKNVFFSSFIGLNLMRARRLLPGVPCGLLSLRGKAGYWGRTFGWRGKIDALNPYFTSIDSNLVQKVHALGKRIYAWTVNSEKDITRMFGLGVDGIITDDVGLAVHLLGKDR